MRRISAAIFSFCLLLGIAGCAPKPVEHLADRNPPLNLEDFFEGETVAYGIFEDRFGNLKRQFRVRIKGTVSYTHLTLPTIYSV